MADTETALRKLVATELVLVIHPDPPATLKYQTDTTAFSQPEGIVFTSPQRRTGVMVREEIEGTGVPVSFIR